MARIIFFGLLTGIFLLFPPASQAQSPAKIPAGLLAKTAAGGQAEFFVILTGQADLSGAASLTGKAKTRYVYETLWRAAQSSQRPLRAWLDGRGVSYRAFYITNALLVEGDRDLLLALAARPDVARLEENPAFDSLRLPAQAPPPKGRSPSTIEAGLAYVNADDVWGLGFTGQGVVIGGQDTGYQWDHPALLNQYRGWNGSAAWHDYNWHDSIHSSFFSSCGSNSPQPCDDHNHGTHTMGSAAGDDGLGNQVGMAPGAEWIGCRNMDVGVGSPATYLECFEFFLAPYPVGDSPANGAPDLAPDVTINSWSCPPGEGCSWQTLQGAIEAHRAAGIMTVAAVGNAGSNCSSLSVPPGIYDAAYTIGALETDSDSLAGFSSRGPVLIDGSNRLKPDLAAPGVAIRSSIRNSAYGFLSGTSMATPHVAGAVALIWSAVPNLKNNIAATETILNETAHHLSTTECAGSGWPNNLYGYGRLDVLAAVEAARLPRAAFSFTPSPLNRPVAFANLTTGSLPLTSTWQFGDGATLTTLGDPQPVQHTYTATGTYTITLTASNAFGQSTFTQTHTAVQLQALYLPLVVK